MAAATAALACGAPRPVAPGPGPETTTGDPSRVWPPDQVYLLEVSGVPAPDTTLFLHRGERRVVVLRHGPPDNVTFAEVAFAPDALGPAAGESVRVAIRPRPGVYGVDLETGAPLTAATVTFKYAMHFSAPDAARRQYGSDAAFERVLAIGRIIPDTGIRFLVSTRPASDNLSAVIPGGGSYAVGAPR
ncbi:MAG TPA: hypothetical protein VFU46_12745 [Gemmatimonadales bacterium]|nr:hypothetical protein [Gemmatimonadales bacterium]